MRLARTILVAGLIFALSLAGNMARADEVVPPQRFEKRGIYFSPRCKRAVRGLGLVALTGTGLFVAHGWYQKSGPTKPLEIKELHLSELPVEARDILISLPPIKAPTIDFESVPFKLELENDAREMDYGPPRTRDEAAAVDILRGSLTGSPGEPLPVAYAAELIRNGSELPPIVFHPGKGILKSLTSPGFHLEAGAWYQEEELKRTGTTGLDRALVGDLDCLQRSIIAIHPVAFEKGLANGRIKSSSTSIEFMAFFASLRHEGELKNFWEQTLLPEMRKDKNLTFKATLTLEIIATVAKEPAQDVPSLKLLFKQCQNDLDTVRQILFRLRQRTATLILANPELSELHEMARECLVSPGITQQDLEREAYLANRLASDVNERQAARYILEAYGSNPEKPLPVHIEMSSLDSLRVARFLKKIFELAGLNVPVFINPSDQFKLPFESIRANFTQARLQELGRPFFPSDADRKKFGIEP